MTRSVVLLIKVITFCFALQLLDGNIHSCHQRKNEDVIKLRQQLENQYRKNSTGLTILFGHVHHAGGTAVCHLARNHTITNLRDNCNHPLEFKGSPPTRGTVLEQLTFQQSTSWGFYAVEVNMPRDMIFNGPFLYALVMRHPYLLLLSQYRRRKMLFNFNGDITSFIHYQLSFVNATIEPNRNYYRGEVGFILGKYGATDDTDNDMIEQVKNRLDRFSVILLTERMRVTGKLFSVKFGWNTDNFGLEKVNSHGGLMELFEVAKGLRTEEKQFVRRHLAVDVVAYHYAWCLARQELKRNSIDLGPYLFAHIETLFN